MMDADPASLAISLLYAEVAPPDFTRAFHCVVVGMETQTVDGLRARYPSGAFTALTSQTIASAPDEIDILVLKSVWSSSDDATRAALVRIVAEKLNPTGLAVIDYATAPGTAMPAVLRRIGLDLGEKAQAAQSLFFKTNPLTTQLLDTMRGRPMGTHFHVSSFQDMARTMTDVELHYVAPAKLVDAILKVNFAREAALLLHNEPDVVLREMKKDLMLNRGYRCDIFMRQPQKLDSQKAAERIARTVFAVSLAPEKIEKLALLTAYAEIKPTDSARRVFEILGKGPASALDLAQRRIMGCEDVWKNVDAMMVLMAMDAITPQPG
ncbi:MAG: methyltransferase regulatory domain-containing protein [Rhodospirillaceae bacterium]|nr:methyltransferase regulatory domain-containing protein [Rhodospirillaceae bacterium]